ncbi:hypothetical protein [Burkholderia glumae]|uniref:hypothetical protein n=1 Tax=Burkholderia glumae TaxID=337 RepID=UPI0021514AB2|nr:hypothetical protein [Burkholderia glumae]
MNDKQKSPAHGEARGAAGEAVHSCAAPGQTLPVTAADGNAAQRHAAKSTNEQILESLMAPSLNIERLLDPHEVTLLCDGIRGLVAAPAAHPETLEYPACPACDVGVCSAHGPDQKMAAAKIVQTGNRLTDLKANDIIARADCELSGVVLTRESDGARFFVERGAVRLVTNDEMQSLMHPAPTNANVQRTGNGDLFHGRRDALGGLDVQTNGYPQDKWFTAIFRNVTRDEAKELVEHPKWSAGCWGHAFKQRDEALLERDKARTERDATRASLQIAEPVVTLNDAIAASDTLDIPLPTDTVEQTLELVNMCVARVRAATIEECATVCDELADNNTDSIKETGYLLANQIRSLASSPEPATSDTMSDDGKFWRDMLAAVVCEVEDGEYDHPYTGTENAPGHAHDIPGVWDSDNDSKASKPCEWCITWNRARSALAASPAIPAEVATPEPLSDKGFEAISGDQVVDQNAPAICVGCEGKPATRNDPCAVCGKSSAPAISKIDDALMTAARHAVTALAHAAERYPQYQREYEELSNAIDAASEQTAPAPRSIRTSIRTPMPYIVPGDSDGGECD